MLGLEHELHKTLPIGIEERQKAYINIQKLRGYRVPPYWRKMMDYFLIVQLSGVEYDFDAIIELEDRLIDATGNLGDLDGHDIGQGEVNFFIETSSPKALFGHLQVFFKENVKGEFRAAFRKKDSEEYEVLWPEGLAEFQVL